MQWYEGYEDNNDPKVRATEAEIAASNRDAPNSFPTSAERQGTVKVWTITISINHTLRGYPKNVTYVVTQQPNSDGVENSKNMLASDKAGAESVARQKLAADYSVFRDFLVKISVSESTQRIKLD